MLSAFADGSLFGRRHGDGPPRVLALHGWGRSHRDWDRVLHGLDAIAVDLPGFGATPAPDEPWGLAEYAEAVAPVLADGGPWVVVGHSFGGSVAVHLAAHREHRAHVQALVLTGTPLIRPDRAARRPPLGFRLARWLHRRGILADARMEALRERRGSPDYRAAKGVMRDTFVKVVNEDVAHLLPAVSQPSALVWGSVDEDVPLSVGRDAEKALAEAHLVVLDGVGHDTPAEDPASLRAAIEAALRGQTRDR